MRKTRERFEQVTKVTKDILLICDKCAHEYVAERFGEAGYYLGPDATPRGWGRLVVCRDSPFDDGRDDGRDVTEDVGPFLLCGDCLGGFTWLKIPPEETTHD